MVEIGHDNDEALVFFTQEMVNGDFHVVELDEGRGCGGRVCCFD
jgi:hypothetical protein